MTLETRPVISVRRPSPVDVPALIDRMRHMGQTYESIGRAIGVSTSKVKHWALGNSRPSFEDGRMLLALAARVEELYGKAISAMETK